MLQLAVDMAVATGTPLGFGHVYAPEHYVDAWVAVLDVRHWSPDALAKLKDHLGKAARTAIDGKAGGDNPYEDRGG
jgi:uncharacterized membrane protein